MKNFFNEGNQIYNFTSSSGSGTVINYGSSSDFLTNYGSVLVPVPLVKKLRFLRVRFRFHITELGKGLAGEKRFIYVLPLYGGYFI
jgi:hypothetical protein